MSQRTRPAQKKSAGKSQVKPFWKGLSWLGLVSLLIGLLAYLNDLGLFPFRNSDTPKIVSDTIAPANPGPFPEKFDSTTLYILITRFEDYANVSETECYGRGIESRIEELKNERNLPVRFYYVHAESPNQSDEAASLRDRYYADLIIWGKLRNAGENCQADGFCLKFIPSDTLIHYAGGQIKKQVENDFQPDVSAIDIEEGLINMGGERFDDWLVGMSNLKVGRKKPELFYIDDKWPIDKKAEAFGFRGMAWYSLGLYEKALTDIQQSIGLIPPQEPTYYYLAADCEKRLGNHESAISYFDHSLPLPLTLPIFTIIEG